MEFIFKMFEKKLLYPTLKLQFENLLYENYNEIFEQYLKHFTI